MNDMVCFECVLKHLAAALSYGKEVINGHGKGADLDHRIDFLGELINTEHHLSMMDEDFYEVVSNFRKQIQDQNNIPTFQNLETIRQIFKAVQDRTSEKKVFTDSYTVEENFMKKDYIDFNPDVIYYSITKSEYADLSEDSIKKHLKDFNRIFRVDSQKTLEDILNVSDLTKVVLFVPQNFIMLQDFSSRRFPIFYGTGCFGQITYDNLTAELVDVERFKQVLKDKDYEKCLTKYFSYIKPKNANLISRFLFGVDRIICCSFKERLKKLQFTYWINTKGYNELKRYLKY